MCLHEHLLSFPFVCVCVARGEVVNGGFGLVLDGSNDAAQRAKSMLAWDVSNGVSTQSPLGSVWVVRNITKESICDMISFSIARYKT